MNYLDFCARLSIRPKYGYCGEEVAPFVLTENQRLRVEHRTSRDLVLKHRQTGARTEECARDLWHLATMPDARVAAVTVLDEALVAMATTYELMLEGLAASGVEHGIKRISAIEWRRGNGLLCIGIASRHYRRCKAATITRLHAEEAAYWPATGEALVMLLDQVQAESSEIAICSSWNEKAPRGTFYEMCEQARRGDSPFAMIEMPAEKTRPSFPLPAHTIYA